MAREVERAGCAWCHADGLARSGLRGFQGVLICRDPVACYYRWKTWMQREGRWPA